MVKPSSITWLGPVGDMGGYGKVSRNYLRILENIGVPIRVFNNGPFDEEIGIEDKQLISSFQKRFRPENLGDSPFLLIHSAAESFVDANIEHFVGANPGGFAKKIGLTIFETDRIPKHWVDLCNKMDEIWVPTQFNFGTFTKSGVDVSKVKVVHQTIDFKECNQTFKPYLFPAEVRSFKFLYTLAFDYRKGLDLLIPSYCEEFSNREDVSLIIKIYNPGWNKDDNFLKVLSSYIPQKANNPHIHFIIEKMSRSTLLSLYSSCTCYVSTEKAYGWGLPQMEMMAMGKPVISINWGGGTEFMNNSNSFLIEAEQELEFVHNELQKTRPEIYLGHKCAKVNKENVKKVMREAFKNHIKREEVAAKAKEDIKNKFSFEKIGEQIKKNLLLN